MPRRLEVLCCSSVERQSHHTREGGETSGRNEARRGAQAAFSPRPPKKDPRGTNPGDANYNYGGRNPGDANYNYGGRNPENAYYNHEGENPELQMVVGGEHTPRFSQSTPLPNIPASHGRSPNETSLMNRHFEQDSRLPMTRRTVPPEGTDPEGSEARRSNGQVANLDEGQVLNRKDQKIFELNEEVKKLRAKVEEKKNENLILMGQVRVFTEKDDAMEQKYEARESRIRGEHQRDREALAESHRVKLVAVEGKARQEFQQAQAKLDEMSRLYAKEKNDLEQGFDNQTKFFEKKHRNEILAWKKDMQLVEDQCIQQIDQHEKDSLRKITEIETNHKSEKLVMIQDRQRAEDGFKQQIAQLEQERSRKVNDIKTMEAEHKAKIGKMKANYESDKIAHVRGLKETVEILKMELAKRDHFKAMSDRELANRFKEIANEVDDFSRYPWEKDQESSWPFTLPVVLSSEKNERVTKQEIMQNTLWVILYKNIFCTPFRVLGEKGKALEFEWVHQGELLCGCTVSMTKFAEDKGSNGAATLCPRPTKASEKWRYETMKECVEAITEPGIVVKANRNVKGGYELTLKEITDALSHELARVALVDTNDKQRMELLVKKAAQLWLEVGQQRSRMYLLMSNSGHEPAQSSPASLNRDGRMELVVVPEVRRKGNVQGDRLGEDELVSDCKGEFSIFPRR